MNKMLIGVFDTDSEAYKGLDTLKNLDEKGDITLYASAVLVSDENGKVDVKQTDDEGPVGIALGMVTGAMVGLLGGPVGVAVGTSMGGLTGLAFDVGSAGINVDFLDEVSKTLIPGKSAVVAEVDEDWVTPVDSTFKQLGGFVIRRPRSEVIEDQLVRDSEDFNREVQELREELKEGTAESKAHAQKTLKSIQEKVRSVEAKAKAQITHLNDEVKAKVEKLETQMKKAHKEQKQKIEKRIDEIKVDQVVRSEKLRQARELAHEALAP